MQDKKLRRRRGRRSWSALDIVFLVPLVLFSITIIYAFYTTFLQSIVPHTYYIQNPMLLIPTKFDFSPYVYVFTESVIPRAFLNTVVITVAHSAFRMTMITMVAYIMTRRFPGEKLLYIFIMIPVVIPGGGVITIYLLIEKLHLTNNLLSLILPGSFAWGTAIIMSRFFCDIPYELEEAAIIDGASEWTVIWKVIVPLALPIIATYTLYSAVSKWNEWYNGMLYMRTATKMPLQTILRSIIQESQNVTMPGSDDTRRTVYNESIKMACLMVAMVPIMCVYPFIQKHFIPGLKEGAVKG